MQHHAVVHRQWLGEGAAPVAAGRTTLEEGVAVGIE